MRNLVILTFLIASISGVVKGVEPSDIEGVYLGSRCGVRATIINNRMKFEIVKDSGVIAEDNIPLFKFEQLEEGETFLFEREVFGRSGEETKIVSGTILGTRLRSLKIKTKGSGFRSSKTKSCSSLIPQGRF